MAQKASILDIVRITGLSRGTVDRVLHNRGEVSKKSREKVMQAVRELGYEPDLNASLLARREELWIFLLVPEKEEGSFWELAMSGLGRVQESLLPLRIRVEHIAYDQFSEDSFREACARLLSLTPSAVVIAPIFRDETRSLTEELGRRSIPYVYIDSKLETEGYLAYFGMPMYKSGFLCANILTGGQEETLRDLLIVRIHRDKQHQSDPTVNRRAGFMDYILRTCPDCRVHTRFIDSSDAAQTMATLEAFFGEHPEARDIVMFNSRIHLLVPYLLRHPDPLRRVVGFDNLAANIDALRHGTVSALIGQHPEVQVAQAVQTLADYIVFGRQPARRDNFMHMDILTQFNYEDY